MKRYFPKIVVAVFLASANAASACLMATGLNIKDVSYADAVVVGSIENYEIVRDMAFRERRLSDPNLRDESRAIYSDPNKAILGDYARFEVLVTEVIVGDVPQRFSATWDNSTFGEPASLSDGQLLMAFRRAESPIPPLTGPSATILPNPEPQSLTILQAPCAPPFIFENSSETALRIKELLAKNP